MILNSKTMLFQNIYFDVLIGVSFFAFFVGFLILMKLNKLRKFYRLIAKTNDLITDIRTTPVADKIMHVEFIVADNGNLEKEFLTWWTIFELVYEVKFRQIANEFYEIIYNPNMRFNSKNYKKLLSHYTNLKENIYSVNLMLIDDINRTLRFERIYRDFFVKINNLYLKLLSQLFQQNYFGDIDNGSFADRIKESINTSFSFFYRIMDEGKWQNLKDPTDELKQYLEHLIYVIDYIPYFKNENENVIPKKMNSLRNTHITFSKRGTNIAQASRVEKFSELEREVEKRRRDLRKQIENFQYLKCSKTYDDIYRLIFNYENFANYEEGIQQKIRYFSEEISDILTKTDKKVNLLMRKVQTNINVQDLNFDFFEFQKRVNEIASLKDEWILLSSKIGGERNQRPVDYNDVKKNTETILNSFIEKSNFINKCEKEINKSQTTKNELMNQIIVVESWVDQSEIKIIKYYSVNSLKQNFSVQISNIRVTLMELKKQANLTNDENVINKLFLKIGEVVSDITSVWQKINETIFFDYISQELVVYITRFKDDNNDYEKFISNCIIQREQGKYREAIDNMLNIIPELKRRRG